MSSSENIHPVLELENAFYEAFSPVFENDNDRNIVDDQRFNRFMELARNLEVNFMQKRFLLNAHKPELILREDIADLKIELQRKEDLIRRHNEKIHHWQTLLQELQTGIPKTHNPILNQTLAGDGVLSNRGLPQTQPAPLHPPGSMHQQSSSVIGAPSNFQGGGGNFRQNPTQQSPLVSLERTTTTIGR